MPRDTELLRSMSQGRPIGVDREKSILRGYVVAQLGPFKEKGRGEFDMQALESIIALNKTKLGLKSRFSHPSESDDGLGKHLGRSRDYFMGEAKNHEGNIVPAVRGDLHFDKTALQEPVGGGKPLGVYVMDLAESDPDAISSSLQLRVKKEFRRNKDKTLMTDADGNELPPLWRPEKLWASDVVDLGAASDGLLSVDDLPNSMLWRATEFLNTTFEGLSREELREKVSSWFDKYLDGRYGPEEAVPEVRPAEVLASVEQVADKLLSEIELRQRRLRMRQRSEI